MDLDYIQTHVTSWFTEMTGLEVQWEEEPEYVYPGPFAILNVGPIIQIGHNGWRHDWNAETEELEIRQFGVRHFTVYCRVRTYDQRQAFSARQALESLRLSYTSPKSQALLSEARLAVVRPEALQNQDYTFDNRRISQHTLDIVFAIHAIEALSGHDGTTIRRVTGSGTVNDTAIAFDSDGETL